jgi:hypothetical protein
MFIFRCLLELTGKGNSKFQIPDFKFKNSKIPDFQEIPGIRRVIPGGVYRLH